MAYKKDTVVISVPVTHEVNQMLREIVLLNGYKSKTQYAGLLLSKSVEARYRQLQRERKWNNDTDT